jgi:SAM-dependent methyltransferase
VSGESIVEVLSMTLAAYDPYADWYEHYIRGPAAGFTQRVQRIAADLLGPGAGPCLDVCCGTGILAATVRGHGWDPVGVDISRGQLGYAVRHLPVAAGDATALPVRSGSVPAAVCLLGHTDVSDYDAVLREVARTLRPGGRLVHVGVHPCFTGAFADRSDPARIVIDDRYAARTHTFDTWCPTGVRARVGAWHVPLADLLNGVRAAGLRLERVVEDGPGVPDVLGLLARAD